MQGSGKESLAKKYEPPVFGIPTAAYLVEGVKWLNTLPPELTDTDRQVLGTLGISLLGLLPQLSEKTTRDYIAVNTTTHDFLRAASAEGILDSFITRKNKGANPARSSRALNRFGLYCLGLSPTSIAKIEKVSFEAIRMQLHNTFAKVWEIAPDYLKDRFGGANSLMPEMTQVDRFARALTALEQGVSFTDIVQRYSFTRGAIVGFRSFLRQEKPEFIDKTYISSDYRALAAKIREAKDLKELTPLMENVDETFLQWALRQADSPFIPLKKITNMFIRRSSLLTEVLKDAGLPIRVHTQETHRKDQPITLRYYFLPAQLAEQAREILKNDLRTKELMS